MAGKIMSKIIIKKNLIDYKNNIFKSKKYWMIFIILLLLGSLSMISINNIEHPKMEILMFSLVSIVGVFLISYYFANNSDENLYKIAFSIILIFGIMCVFFMPICQPSDCGEHLARSEITSRGILFPEFTGNNYSNFYSNGTDILWDGSGFEIIQSVNELIDNRFNTFLTMDNANVKINNTLVIYYMCAEQNPFYGYLPQALGILIAKLLDLNVIWLLWLARLMNLLFYAGVVSYAVKKSPIFKIPIIFTACLPMVITQVTSVSIDSMIFALTFLLIAYFFYMYESEENSLTTKNIIIFISLSLIVGLLKLPHLAFSLLIFAVPIKNFKNKNKVILYSVLGIIIIGTLGLLWSHSATDALWHSGRAKWYIMNNVNATSQLNFLLNNKSAPLLFIANSIEYLRILSETFYIYDTNGRYTLVSGFVSTLILIVMGVVYIAYPINEKFDLKSKAISLLTICIVYIGICFANFLTWSAVGQFNFSIHPRYLQPLLLLAPLIFGINFVEEKKVEFNHYIITLTITFIALWAISLVIKFY